MCPSQNDRSIVGKGLDTVTRQAHTAGEYRVIGKRAINLHVQNNSSWNRDIHNDNEIQIQGIRGKAVG